MTKQLAKQYIARIIRDSYICNKIESLKMENINKIMTEKGITRTQLKATIRSGNASFVMKDDSDGKKTEAMKAEICEWIDQNFDKPKKHRGL